MTKRTQSNQAAEAGSSSQNPMEQTRQNLANYAQGTSAILRGAESFHRVQQQTFQRVALAHQQATERLRDATSPAEVMGVQSQLMLSGLQDLTQYMQELLMAAVKVQSEMMSTSGDSADSAASSASATSSSASAAARPAVQQAERATAAAMPMFQAWQDMMMSSLNGSAASRTH